MCACCTDRCSRMQHAVCWSTHAPARLNVVCASTTGAISDIPRRATYKYATTCIPYPQIFWAIIGRISHRSLHEVWWAVVGHRWVWIFDGPWQLNTGSDAAQHAISSKFKLHTFLLPQPHSPRPNRIHRQILQWLGWVVWWDRRCRGQTRQCLSPSLGVRSTRPDSRDGITANLDCDATMDTSYGYSIHRQRRGGAVARRTPLSLNSHG